MAEYTAANFTEQENWKVPNDQLNTEVDSQFTENRCGGAKQEAKLIQVFGKHGQRPHSHKIFP